MSRTGAKRRWVEIGLILLIFFTQAGTPAPQTNEAQYLAKAKHFWSPDWCENDQFLNSGNAHYGFFFAFGWISLFCTLDVLAWIGRIAGWLLIACGWQRLIARLTSDRWASVLSAGLWVFFVDRFHMSGEWVIGGIEGKVFAYGFVLLALEWMVEAKWNRVWPLLGIASSFHVLVGGWSVLAGLFAFACQTKMAWQHVRSTLPFLFLGGILSLPGLAPAVWAGSKVDPVIFSEGCTIYVFERLSHHLVLHEFRWQFIARFLLLTGCWMGIAWWLRSCASYRKLAAFVVGSLIIAAIGGVIDFSVSNQETAAKLLRYYWFRLADVTVPLGVASGMFVLVEKLRDSHGQFAKAVQSIVAICVLAHLTFSIPQQRFAAVPEADRQGVSTNPWKVARWRETCRWIAENTPRDCCVFAPPSHQTFKWYAGRAEFVNWKDVSQDPENIIEWHERLQQARRIVRRGRWNSPEENTRRLIELAEQYDLDYFIAEKRQALPPFIIPKVFENESYIVYEINSE